jgi:transcriptional regulator with XRE-family HTH domain
MASFGQNLARMRQEAGVTRLELAKRSGLSRQMIDGYERDIEKRFRNPSYRSVVRLASALFVSVVALAGDLNIVDEVEADTNGDRPDDQG